MAKSFEMLGHLNEFELPNISLQLKITYMNTFVVLTWSKVINSRDPIVEPSVDFLCEEWYKEALGCSLEK